MNKYIEIMNYNELKQKATKYFSDKGYGTGSNFTTNTVIALMTKFAQQEIKNLIIPVVMKSVCDHNYKQYEDGNCNAKLRCTKCKDIL